MRAFRCAYAIDDYDYIVYKHNVHFSCIVYEETNTKSVLRVLKFMSNFNLITVVSPFVTGGEYSGSPGSANRLTNCPIPIQKKRTSKSFGLIKKKIVNSLKLQLNFRTSWWEIFISEWNKIGQKYIWTFYYAPEHLKDMIIVSYYCVHENVLSQFLKKILAFNTVITHFLQFLKRMNVLDLDIL